MTLIDLNRLDTLRVEELVRAIALLEQALLSHPGVSDYAFSRAHLFAFAQRHAYGPSVADGAHRFLFWAARNYWASQQQVVLSPPDAMRAYLASLHVSDRRDAVVPFAHLRLPFVRKVLDDHSRSVKSALLVRLFLRERRVMNL